MLMPTADRLQFRRRLEDAAGDAGAMQHETEREAADAGAMMRISPARTGSRSFVRCALRESLLRAPGCHGGETNRQHRVVAGQGDAEQAPSDLVAADQSEVLHPLISVLAEPRLVIGPEQSVGPCQNLYSTPAWKMESPVFHSMIAMMAMKPKPTPCARRHNRPRARANAASGTIV
ncbi:MAG: hypothetical protein WDN48_03015 [Pseudolabrys sp.]